MEGTRVVKTTIYQHGCSSVTTVVQPDPSSGLITNLETDGVFRSSGELSQLAAKYEGNALVVTSIYGWYDPADPEVVTQATLILTISKNASGNLRMLYETYDAAGTLQSVRELVSIKQ